MQHASLENSKLAEFKRGWTVVFAGFVGITTGAWVFPFYILGPMIKTLQSDFGWSRVGIMAGGSCLSAGLLISSPITGRLIDRIGPRPVALVSLAASALGMLAMTQLNANIWGLYTIMFVVGLLGAGTGSAPFAVVLERWFSKGRGLALGIILMGIGAGSFIAPFLAAQAVQLGNWRLGYFMVAGCMSIGLPVVFFLLKDPPERIPQTEVSDHGKPAPEQGALSRMEILRDRRFQAFMLTFALIGSADSGMILQLAPLLNDNGYELQHAAAIISLLGIAGIVGRLGTGWLLDRYPPHILGAMILAMTAAGCVGFLADKGTLGFVVVLGIGLTVGASTQLMAFMPMKYFDMRNYGLITGMLLAVFSAASLTSPLTMGFIFQNFGEKTGLIVAGCVYATASTVLGLSGHVRSSMMSRS